MIIMNQIGSVLTGKGERTMPDREKTIRVLETMLMTSHTSLSETELDAIRTAVELLKEQEGPKQIVRKQCKIEHNDGSVDYFAEWYCPHCKSLIVRGFDNPSIKFCYKCGKPILWEGR
jgi:hypothetical protein